jgi:hypothetical protein
MAAENDGKPWRDDDIQNLKTLITENTPTRLIAMAEGLSMAPTNSPRD